jgi:hypothetical protein
MGKIYPCNNTLHLESQRVDTLLSVITTQLILGPLMHAEFTNELCSLLLHIPTYLHVMRFYNYDLHGFQGFSKQSSLFWF